MKPILSICIIVKNEEKVLKRCLESLKPLMEEVSSELIITDTGSTDKTVDIAREYTDKIIFFEWINDFSAARNTGIKQANGKWLFFIDADTWLVEYDEIINFLKLEEQQTANLAYIKIRNLWNVNGQQEFTDFYFPCLFKIYDGIKYEGKIHEAIYYPNKKGIKLNALALHSGYDYENEEEKISKQERNNDLIIEEYENHPDDLRNVFHLIRHLISKDGISSAKKYIDRGYDLVKDDNSNLFFSNMFYFKVELLIGEEKFSYAVEICDEYISKRAKVSAKDLDFYFLKARALEMMQDWENVIKAYENYIIGYKAHKKGQLIDDLLITETLEYEKESHFTYALLSQVKGYYFTDQIEKAIELLKSVSLDDTILDNLKVLFNLAFMCCQRNRNFTLIIDFYQKAVSTNDETMIKTFIDVAEENLKNNFQDFKLYVEEFSIVENDATLYIKLQKLRLYDLKGDEDSTKKLLNDFLNLDNWSTELYDLIFYSFKYYVDFKTVLCKINIEEFSIILNKIIHLHKDFHVVIFKYFYNVLKVMIGTEQYIPLIAIIFENALIYGNNCCAEDIMNCFNAYAETMEKYLKMIYKEYILSDENSFILPAGFRAGYFAYRAIEECDDETYKHYINKICDCNPEMKDTLKILV